MDTIERVSVPDNTKIDLFFEPSYRVCHSQKETEDQIKSGPLFRQNSCRVLKQLLRYELTLMH